MHHKPLWVYTCGNEGGFMPGKRVLPEQRLDYHVNFTLQQSVGKHFADACKDENVAVQEKLRYLVEEYLAWKESQKNADER
jgi:hypothetical protein